MSQTLTTLAIPFIPADSESNKHRGTFSKFMGISDKLVIFCRVKVSVPFLAGTIEKGESHYEDVRTWRQFTRFSRSDRETIGRF